MKKIIALLLALAMVFALVACGDKGDQPNDNPGSDTPASQTPADSGNAELTAEQALYEAAKKEGVVQWQVAADVSAFQPLIDAFEKKYPGIKVEAFNVTSQTMVSRIITEAAGNALTVDVAMVQSNEFLDLTDLAVKYDWNSILENDSDLILYDGAYVRCYDNAPLFIYNTNMLSKDQVPTSLDDLMGSEWADGKFAVSATGLFAAYYYDVYEKNPQEALDKIEKLLGQEPIIASSGVQIVESVANGEYAVGWAPGPSALSSIKNGAPIAACPMGTTYNTTAGTFVIEGCKHPNAALLLNSFLASKEAREIWANGSMCLATEGAMGELLAATPLKFGVIADLEGCKNLSALTQATAEMITGLKG